ncbi:hypothetical protein ORI89_17385 [Sphingobacterium sp. UT-1RO-CII-1]|uniref:hypothetical protein n=1 Tax=Sphingobacterium sp. UT-1RO-CII-1 TaxID=2995225 RepID=UPI00227C7E90|nr:hypothetical protein [Sphingobacterium sp. UT-1RO-CII-1]MCY4781436.1 hypothetical protein [Sphingobacterium sp. UT-1RO-CII-1]
MGLIGIKRTGTQGFQKVVFENVVDTLPGGLILDVKKADYPDGYVPAGTLVGRDANGVGKVVKTIPGDSEAEPPTKATTDIKPIGRTYRDSEVCEGGNTYANGVVISGTARIKALPDSATAAEIEGLTPRITLV